ncbi:DUF2274 domain-containing protein [Bradyrhizobium sp. CCBAU 11357]|uniref:DUF2274 domain-containing protein n=1 Tax=Bradyrhizobium sp. CCBAU 11357 TaxID=1630808 RepID=UPI00230259FD|nr:DUF2274 domain-containing protein [Bradyrhizobium sp. CCBAU 11357]MDA9500844.1 protein involved in integration/excision of ICE Tn4371 family [Bradyrhizobium sp. CCBAU 11357]
MKLAKLPDRTPVRLNIVLTPGLAQRLREYAVYYAETYGNKEEVAELVPFMLEAFLDSDPSLKRSRKVKGASASLNGSGDQE